jgi:hypothetical protein
MTNDNLDGPGRVGPSLRSRPGRDSGQAVGQALPLRSSPFDKPPSSSLGTVRLRSPQAGRAGRGAREQGSPCTVGSGRAEGHGGETVTGQGLAHGQYKLVFAAGWRMRRGPSINSRLRSQLRRGKQGEQGSRHAREQGGPSTWLPASLKLRRGKQDGSTLRLRSG